MRRRLSLKWVDQGVVYPFNYPAACLCNPGVRIIEVLLYQTVPKMPTTEYKHRLRGYYTVVDPSQHIVFPLSVYNNY